jgi:putative flippase GtrA
MSIAQYVRFLVVGASVGLITVGFREVIGRLLGVDTAFHYSVSVIVAYALGVVLSFLINQRVTFEAISGSHQWRMFFRFIAIALLGLVMTWLLSIAVRYGIRLDDLTGRFAAALSFGTAAFLSSLITYPLNALLVFRKALASAT